MCRAISGDLQKGSSWQLPRRHLIGITGTAPSATRVASYSLAVVESTGAIVNGTFETNLSGWTDSGSRKTVTLVPHTCDLQQSFQQVTATVKAGHT
jgi:hypothetical protein